MRSERRVNVRATLADAVRDVQRIVKAPMQGGPEEVGTSREHPLYDSQYTAQYVRFADRSACCSECEGLGGDVVKAKECSCDERCGYFGRRRRISHLCLRLPAAQA